jgi:drug/metabolite transporter (DMT)-like permease
VTQRRAGVRPAAALLAVSAIWGVSFVFVKGALESATNVTFLAMRFSLATLFLWLFFRGALAPGDWRAEIRPGLLAGTALFLGYLTQTAGLKLTTPAKAAFLTTLYIPLIPLLSALVYQTGPRVVEWLGIVIATCGLALLTFPESGWEVARGDLLVALCALPYAVHVLVLGRYAPRANAARLSLYQVGTAAALALGTFWWIETPRVSWTGSLFLGLGFGSLMATAVAFALQSWAQKYASAASAALLLATEPVFAALASASILGERLTPRSLAGAALILGGVLLVELKPGVPSGHPSG